jgi:hypothetical protein
MYYTLEKMMTVEDYVNELVADARYESTYERVEDYMYALREESINSQKAAFITIQDYIEELTAEDIILVSKIEKQISEKAIKEAKELEQLLA